MSIENQRKHRAKRMANKAKKQRVNCGNGFRPQSEADKDVILTTLTLGEKLKIIDIVNEAGRQWQWSLPEDRMVETPNPDHDEYTMETLEMDMAFLGRALKDLDCDGWLFAILVEQGGTQRAATIFSRLGKVATGRHWVGWNLNPALLRAI